jgi:hypothetical protein
MSTPPPTDVPAPQAESPPVSRDASAAEARCANCGAMVMGSYCSACGQRRVRHVLSVGEFLREAAEVLTHADSRLWRTFIPLLARPGFLTQEYLRGRRASYLPPLRLYFVLSVLFFLLIALTAQVPTPTDKGSIAVRDATLNARAEIQQELDKSTDPQEQALLRKLLALNAPSGKLAAAPAAGSCRDLINAARVPDWLQQGLVATCEKARADHGQALQRNLIHNLGRAMFVFLPLLAALMKLLYWRQKRYYVEHLLLLLHNHAFAFLIMSAFLVTAHLSGSDTLMSWLSFLISLWVTYYLYRSMRRVYGQSAALTGVKFVTLALVYSVCAVLALALTALYSAVTL